MRRALASRTLKEKINRKRKDRSFCMDGKIHVDLSVEVPGDIPDDAWYGTVSEERQEDSAGDLESDVVEQDLTGWYDQKNDYLRNHPSFRELDTDLFLRLIFCRGDDFEYLPFEEEWCEAYEWWTEHPRSAKRPPKYSYVYNGIAQAIYGKHSKQKNKTFVITSQATQIYGMLQHPFVIMSPVSYTGKRRLKNNARYLYAIAIDIDGVDAKNVENLLFQSDPTRKRITFPQPNIIVNSGNGIHIYYLLETPAPMFKDTYAILNKIKKELTRRVWNIGTTHENPDKPQFQGNCQGFRLPGTQTKFRKTVTAFQNINPAVKKYYKVEDLAYGGGGWITEEELALVRTGTYNPSRCTLKQARELWPEWYERRIILGHQPNRWYIKRDLYDWWKKQVPIYATVGHRYFCMMALAIYAKKCDISEEEFRSDLESFVDVMDALSHTPNPEDRFTIEDANDAASAFNENYCTFPIDDIRAITGVPVERNRTRKGRRQEEHLFDIRAIRDARCARDGVSWREGNGRKNKFHLVNDWRAAHPDGTKYACAKELGIDKKTVMKWWDTTEQEWQAAKARKDSIVISEVEDTQTQELHDLGAAYNAPYVTDRKVAESTMQHVEGYEEQTPETIRETRDELTDAINYGALNMEDLMRSMGVPEFLIPMLKAEFQRQMQTPEFWEKYKKDHPTVDMSKWPPQARAAFDAAVKEHNKKK